MADDQETSPSAAGTSFWRELWRGATRPSTPALVGILLVAAGWLGTATLAIDAEFLTSLPRGYFLEHPRDHRAQLAMRVLRLRQKTKVHRAVTVIGSSTIQHALTGAGPLGQMLTEEVGRPTACHLLCAGGLSLPRFVAIADQIKDHVAGVVVVNVSMRHMLLAGGNWAGRGAGSDLGLSSPLLRSELEDRGIDSPAFTGNYVVDQYRFVLPRVLPALWHMVTGPIPEYPFHELQTFRGPDVAWFELRLAQLSKTRRSNFDENSADNFRSLEHLIVALQASGKTQVALLESTLSPRYRDAVDPRYLQAMQEFADRLDVPYWNLNEAAELRNEDFIDYGHIKERSARERFSREFARRVAVLLSGESP